MTETQPKPKMTKGEFVELCLLRLNTLTLEEAATELNTISTQYGLGFQFDADAVESHLRNVGLPYVRRKRGHIQVNQEEWEALRDIESNVTKYQFIARGNRPNTSETRPVDRTGTARGLSTRDITEIKKAFKKRSARS